VRIRQLVIAIVILPCGSIAQNNQLPMNVLPATATAQLDRSLQAARAHA
jgi:hypothetical protein